MISPSIEQQLAEILSALSDPPTPEELQGGWTQESKHAAHKYVTELSAALNSGAPLPPLGIVRGLDHWGVIGGDLLESIAKVSNTLRKAYGGK